MDWKKLVVELMEAGVTQTQIAEECGVAQATVSDLSRVTRQPSFDFGTKLIALHRRLVAEPAKAA
jgi:predicted transcriptional regulator